VVPLQVAAQPDGRILVALRIGEAAHEERLVRLLADGRFGDFGDVGLWNDRLLDMVVRGGRVLLVGPPLEPTGGVLF